METHLAEDQGHLLAAGHLVVAGHLPEKKSHKQESLQVPCRGLAGVSKVALVAAAVGSGTLGRYHLSPCNKGN